MTGQQLDLFAPEGAAELVTPAGPHELHTSTGYRMAGVPRRLQSSAGCRTCRWGSGWLDRENDAVEAALDHAWPGWRALPVITWTPCWEPAPVWRQRLADVDRVYPDGWVAAGGPIRTARSAPGNRHCWNPDWHFWDIAAPPEVTP